MDHHFRDFVVPLDTSAAAQTQTPTKWNENSAIGNPEVAGITRPLTPICTFYKQGGGTPSTLPCYPYSWVNKANCSLCPHQLLGFSENGTPHRSGQFSRVGVLSAGMIGVQKDAPIRQAMLGTMGKRVPGGLQIIDS